MAAAAEDFSEGALRDFAEASIPRQPSRRQADAAPARVTTPTVRATDEYSPSSLMEFAASSAKAAQPSASQRPGVRGALDTMPAITTKDFIQDQIQPSDIVKTAGKAVQNIGNTILSGYEGLRVLVNGGNAAEAANAVSNPPLSRGARAESTGEKVLESAIHSPYNPLNWPAMVGSKAGDATLTVTGSPAAATAVDTAISASPLLLLRGATGKPIAVPRTPEIPATAAAGGTPVALPSAANLDISPAIRQRMEARQAQSVPLADVGKPTPQAAPTQSAKLAPAEQKPVNLAELSDVEPVSGGLPKTFHPERQAVLERIGLQKTRNSAIEGDALKGATDYQLAKFTEEPVGRAAAEQFSAEKSALSNHARSIAQRTGGTIGMDEGALIARGTGIADALSALKDYFRQSTRKLYAEADAKLGSQAFGVPEGFSKLINTESEFAGKSTNQSLGNGIKLYLREQGIMDKDGALRHVTVKEVEGIKQYINSQYSHETAGLAGKIKATLDNDVFSNAGADVYAAGRDMHKQYSRTLGDPKGVSSIIDVDPRNPMNRAVALEKIPDTVTKMSNAQYNHLLKTLREMPPELKPLADKAIKEIQAHWAEKLLDRGTGTTPDAMWNAPRVTNEIRVNAEKIAKAFEDNPRLLYDIKDLQEAGNILRVNMSYPGASAQAANAVKRGAMTNLIRPASASVGGSIGAIFGPAGAGAGAMAGSEIGARVAASVGERAALTRWEKSTTKLKDVRP